MKIRVLYLLIIQVVLLTSCHKWLFKDDIASKDPYINFDYLWNEVDKKYAYFQLKQVNWDSIKTVYRSKLYYGITEDTLFTLLGNMLNELRDDHTNLLSPFSTSRYNVFIQGEDNFEYKIIQKYYIKDSEYTIGGFKHGFINGFNIGYVRYASFAININNSELDYILERYKSTVGLIIDLRENSGGNFVNIPKILERFTLNKTLVMYNRTRNGSKREDFGPYEPFYISPSDRTRYLNKPVIVLIDRGSYSATTFFALATKAMNNITLVGDKTGGGGGLPNGGQLPNGWTYRFSITQSYDLNKVNYAEDGVEPDFYSKLEWYNLTKDEIVDFSINLILKK